MSVLRSVPWTSWLEWDNVRQLLYSEDVEDRRLGVKRVAAWVSRGRAPISATATANLVEAMLKDFHGSEDSFVSDTEKVFMYSMAIVRMLNGLIAPFHGQTAAPMSVVAKKLGLPANLVEIRHQASHQAQLPSILVLRIAAKQALDWLAEKYWKQLKISLQNYDDELLKILERLFTEMKAKTSKNRSPPGDDSRKGEQESLEVPSVIFEITRQCSASRVNQSLVPMLLDNFFVPKTSSPKKINVLPERLVRMFTPALDVFVAEWPHFVHCLLIAIVQRVVDSRSEFGHTPTFRIYWSSMLVCWYNHIINTYINAPQSSRPRLHVPYISIASLCGDKLDKWSTKILGLTLPHISDEELANRVDAVVSYFREAKSIRLQERGKKRKRTDAGELSDDGLLDIKEFTAELRKTLAEIQRKKRKLNLFEETTDERKETSSSGNIPATPKSVWIPIDPLSVSHGVGLFRGQIPLLDLPVALDDFKLATFLVPVSDDLQETTGAMDNASEQTWTEAKIQQISAEITIFS